MKSVSETIESKTDYTKKELQPKSTHSIQVIGGSAAGQIHCNQVTIKQSGNSNTKDSRWMIHLFN